jgi:putative DNA primase/helicase
MVNEFKSNGKPLSTKATLERAAEKPQAIPVVAEGIPPVLRKRRQWVCWKYVRRDGKWTKTPIQAITGRAAKSTDPTTWATFEEALAYYQAHKSTIDGIGYVFAEDDPFVGTDLDDCRNPESGKLAAHAVDVVDGFHTYAEVSPSGTGIKIFAIGTKPGERCETHKDGAKYEMYSQGRFFTVTGHRLPTAPATVENAHEAIDTLYKWMFGQEETTKAKAKPVQATNDLDDDELIRRASEASNGAKFRALWAGEVNGYADDDSRADLALCGLLAFWTGGDAARMDRLFRLSGLYRDKWDRENYRTRTIEKALAGKTEFYEPKNGRGAYFGNADGHEEFGDRAPDSPPAEIHLTDKGNAQRVVERHGQALRYCHPWKSWLVWDGKRWRLDDTAEAVRRVKETQAALYAWAAEQLKELGEADGEDEAKKSQAAKLLKLLKHCLTWEHQTAIERCLKSMTSEPGIPILPAALDADPFLLNVHNGPIDLRTGKLREHRQADFITKLAGTEYHENAACPLWLACLSFWMKDNDDLIGYLQRVIGYLLTGSVDEQCLWLFHGSGANGKSTLLLNLLALLGDYAWQSVADLLMTKKMETHPTERADLFGKRLVATIETEEGQRVAEALTKQLTGGDKVTARRMRQDFFSFTPTHKIIMAANHKPRIQGRDYAVWRRIKLVPFEASISEEAKDKRLVEKLKAEFPGILAWAVRGCLEWQKHGLGEPDEIRQATTAYQAEQDLLAAFIGEVCFVHPTARVQVKVFHEQYQDWTGDKFTSRKALSELMRGKGYATQEGAGHRTFYVGIGIPETEKREAEWTV